MTIFNRSTPLRFLTLPAVACLAFAFSGCGSTAEARKPGETSAYAVNIVRGAAVELDHANYDSELGGYWLVGESATLQLSRIAGVPEPETFSFMIRTKPDASVSKPSEIDLLKILTPRYRIVTKFNPAKTAPVDVLAYRSEKEGTEAVLVKTDSSGEYITFERVGERVKVTLTAAGMRLIGDAAALTWSDLKPGERSEADKDVLQAEGYRRVL